MPIQPTSSEELVRVQAKLPPELAAELCRSAKRSDRTIAAEIRHLLRSALADRERVAQRQAVAA